MVKFKIGSMRAKFKCDLPEKEECCDCKAVVNPSDKIKKTIEKVLVQRWFALFVGLMNFFYINNLTMYRQQTFFLTAAENRISIRYP